MHTRFPFVGSSEHTKSPQRTQFRLRAEESERRGEVCCTVLVFAKKIDLLSRGDKRSFVYLGGRMRVAVPNSFAWGKGGGVGGKGT